MEAPRVNLVPGTVWDQVGWWDQVRWNTAIDRSRDGAALLRLRRAAGLTQSSLACLVGVTDSMIAHMECGRRNIPPRLLPLIEAACSGSLDRDPMSEEAA